MHSFRKLIAFLLATLVFGWVVLAADQKGDEKAPAEPEAVEQEAEAEEPAQQAEEAEETKDGPPKITPKPEWQVKDNGLPYVSARAEGIAKKTALSPNLVPNPSFEKGRYWPYEWEACDKFGVMWARGGTDGKRYIKLDTMIIEAQWLPWNMKVIEEWGKLNERTKGKPQSVPRDPVPTPPNKQPCTAPYYDTVGGLHGVHYKGPFVKAKRGAIYRVMVDARADTVGGPGAFVWFKGFMDETRRMEGGMTTLKRNAYRYQCKLHGLGKQWKRFAWEAHPALSKSTYKNKPTQPDWYQVQLYGYWGPGIYEFDNVRLDIIGYEEVAHTIANQPKPKKLKTSKPKRDDGGFPVF